MLNFDLVTQHLRRVAPDVELRDNPLTAFHQLALTRPDLRASLFHYPLNTPGPVSAFNSRDFKDLAGGIWQAQRLAKVIAQHASQRSLSILDFGCGAGRLLRYFLLFRPEHQYFGCDVNADAIAWLRDSFAPADFATILPTPPTPYASGQFDVVYGWSIFTHYNEALHFAWLVELRRITRPGGLVLLTVHNDTLVSRYGIEPPLVETMRQRGGDYEAIVREYRDRGFAFWHAYGDGAKAAGIDPETFGMAFISPDYIRAHWQHGFTVEEIVTDIAPRWQDLVVLRKR